MTVRPAVLERLFQLRGAGTAIRTELIAGATTFATLSYITFVQPAVLAGAGMDFGAVIAATCVASGFATALMGLAANYPIAVAPARTARLQPRSGRLGAIKRCWARTSSPIVTFGKAPWLNGGGVLLGELDSPLPNCPGRTMKYLSGSSAIPLATKRSMCRWVPEYMWAKRTALSFAGLSVPNVR